MYLEIITPEKKHFEGEVKSASFPGTSGYFQILNNHAPLVSSISKGKVTFTDKDGDSILYAQGGVVEVLNNRVTLLADKIMEEDEYYAEEL